MAKKRVNPAPQSREEVNIKSFLDMIAPSVVSFMPDHFICGNTYVIEAMNTKNGVVKTQLEGRGWTHWLEIEYINYD